MKRHEMRAEDLVDLVRAEFDAAQRRAGTVDIVALVELRDDDEVVLRWERRTAWVDAFKKTGRAAIAAKLAARAPTGRVYFVQPVGAEFGVHCVGLARSQNTSGTMPSNTPAPR